MNSRKLHSLQEVVVIILFLLISHPLQSQIAFEGLISQNEGAAAWDADGSGSEPPGDGHLSFSYYAASRDYVNSSSDYGSHATGIGADFPAFAQALTDNGFSPGQVKFRLGLASLGDDLEGSDWFRFGLEHYLNFYPTKLSIYVNDELIILGLANYTMFHQGPSTGYEFYCSSNYFVPVDSSASGSSAAQAVAAAFMLDVGEGEVKVNFNTIGTTEPLTGNGRTGGYFNITGAIEKGRPTLPYIGLDTDHEGLAGWDANGGGPEPKRNGHSNQKYFIASRDYDDIDSDPNAGLAHFLDSGIDGFQNFKLQLMHRGFSPGQIKMKMELRSLDEDIEGEDWSFIHPIHISNYYHSNITLHLNGEALVGFVCDTAAVIQDVTKPEQGWWGQSAKTFMYDASAYSSTEVQAVAGSFFKDLQQRQIYTITHLLTATPGSFSGNGRSGGFWQIDSASMVAVPRIATDVTPGNVSGHWTREGNPYLITGDMTVPDGQVLEIDPGVWIKFTGRVHFFVNGSVKAIGDTSNTGNIVFTAVNPDLGWGHIEYDYTPLTNPASEFRHCIFEYGSAPPPVPYNSPYNCGGALAIRAYDKVVIENCLFHHNKALFDGYYPASGGAIALWSSNPEIGNCIFRNNTASCAGGIIAGFGASPAISNCLFLNNGSLMSVSHGGGAVNAFEDSEIVLLNNLFINNYSNFKGGAIEIYNQSDPVLINNILWDNQAPQYSEIYIPLDNCNVDLRYNDIEGGQAGIGPGSMGTGVYENNIDDDPEFIDKLALNYQLRNTSPCVDTGIPDISGLNLPITDLLGNCRVWDGGVNGTRVDIGPYEYGSLPCSITKVDDEKVSGYGEIFCYPNPFSKITNIGFSLSEDAMVQVTIWNHFGQQVTTLTNNYHPAGSCNYTWDASNFPKGLYFVKVQAGYKLIATRLIRL